MTPALVVLLLVALPLATFGVVLSLRYQKWAPRVWQQRLHRHVGELTGRRMTLRAKLSDPAVEISRLTDEHLHRHLKSVPLDRLAEYPGVGPGTVDRLSTAGFRRLADAERARFDGIPGIGPGRDADIRAAVARLAKEERSVFAAGGCPEAVACRRAVRAMNDEATARQAAVGPELAAVDAALKACDPLLALAGRVNFWAFLFDGEVSALVDIQREAVLTQPRPVTPPPPPVRATVVPVPPPAPIADRAVARPATLPPPPVGDPFRERLATPALPAHPAEPSGLAHLRAVAGFGLMIAKADGRIAQAERATVRAFLAERFGHDTVLARHIDPVLERTEKAVPDHAAALAALHAVTTPLDHPRLLAFAVAVVNAAGERSAREKELLAKLATAFGVTAEPAPVRVAAPPSPPPAVDHRAVLDIPQRAELTAELVRRKYALAVDPLDPQKAAALGPEFANLAEQKRTAARVAAEALLAPFGVPLDPPKPSPPADIRSNELLDDVFGG